MQFCGMVNFQFIDAGMLAVPRTAAHMGNYLGGIYYLDQLRTLGTASPLPTQPGEVKRWVRIEDPREGQFLRRVRSKVRVKSAAYGGFLRKGEAEGKKGIGHVPRRGESVETRSFKTYFGT